MLPAPSLNNTFLTINIQKHLPIPCNFSNRQKASANRFNRGFSINPPFRLNSYYKLVFFTTIKRQLQRVKMVKLSKAPNFIGNRNTINYKTNVTHFSNLM